MEKNFTSVEDVLADELFLSWYFKESDEQVQAWEQWLATQPQHQPLVAEAIKAMSQLHISEKNIQENQIVLATDKLNASMDQLAGDDIPVIKMKSRKRWWMSAAAAILITVGLLATWKFTHTNKETICTAYGQLSQHILPDGSEVMLNANSTVELGKNWSNGTDREVWLKGEAFFHVKKTSTRDRFIVHTNEMDIIVTGTQFNVVTRYNKSRILLTEGSVTIRARDGKEFKMLPGDFVEVSGTDHLEKKAVNEEVILAWKANKLYFDETPMPEAAKIISEHYGIKVTLADNAVSKDSLLGIMQNDNLDVLLQSLESAKNYKIVKKEGEIIISKY